MARRSAARAERLPPAVPPRANVAYQAAQHGLLARPDAVVLALWKRLTLEQS
jgi:hypothetical protein